MSGGDALLRAAAAVRLNAYAPYSRFKVGCAIRAEDGRISVGANVENASYPEGLCAEAAAIAAMVAAGQRRIAEIAVVCEGAEPAPPCGGCRQRIAEFADPDTRSISADRRRFPARAMQRHAGRTAAARLQDEDISRAAASNSRAERAVAAQIASSCHAMSLAIFHR